MHGKIAETERKFSGGGRTQVQSRKREELFCSVKRQIKGKEAETAGRRWQSWKEAVLKRKSISSTRSFWRKTRRCKKKSIAEALQKQRIKREEYMGEEKRRRHKAAEQGHLKKTTKQCGHCGKGSYRSLQEKSRARGRWASWRCSLDDCGFTVSSCGGDVCGYAVHDLAASYLSQPKEIDAADLQFTRLELDLQNKRLTGWKRTIGV